MKRDPDAEVLLSLTPTEQGGKSNPIFNSYRPIYDIRPDYWTSTDHELIDAKEIWPGQQGRALVWFLTPEVYPQTLWVGRVLSVAEGSRKVGTATVLKVMNPVLLKEGS